MRTDQPKVLVLTFSRVRTDPRVLRQIEALQDKYRVTVCGSAPMTMDGIEYLQLPDLPQGQRRRGARGALLLSRQFGKYYWTQQPQAAWVMNRLGSLKFQLILANDVETLPLAVALKKRTGAKLLLDAHEYALDEARGSVRKRFIDDPYRSWLCRTSMRHVDAMCTVSHEIAVEYEKALGIPQPAVVRNVPGFVSSLKPRQTGGSIRLIHHGLAARERQLEKLIELMRLLDRRFTLTFMLMPTDLSYLRELRQVAKSVGRVHFISPVPTLDIPATLNDYDLGILLVEPFSISSRLALPNKLFESIQARIGYVSGPTETIAHVIGKYGIGAVSRDFSAAAMAECLNSLTSDDVDGFKWKADEAAKELCWEREQVALTYLLRSQLSD